MKLTYRGITYNYTPTAVNSVETEVSGKYRGLEWRFRNRKSPTVQKPTLDLVYRGVRYTEGEEVSEVKSAVKSAPVPSIGQRARALLLNKERSEIKRHGTMLLRSEERIGFAH